jgi:enoyl-CoA hydratase
MADPVLRVEKDGGIATLTLDRPDAMNALSRQLRCEIADAFAGIQEDPEVRVAILTGAGRAFCAGLDLKELEGGMPGGSRDTSAQDMLAAIGAFEGPVIGAINGFAITGGFELALACDLLVASSEARFADTHARVGILPGWGLSQKLPRLIGIHRAKELSLTGNYLSAHFAETWGLVNRVVAPDQLLPTCRNLAEDMLSCDPESLRGYKRVIDEGFAETLAEGLEREGRTSARHMKANPPDVARRRRAVQERGRQQAQ